MLILNLELAPGKIVVGLKLLLPLMPVLVSYTLTCAVAGITLVTPRSVVRAFAGIVFVKVVADAPVGVVAWTVIVQVPGVVVVPAGMVPLVKLTVRGTVVETTPPQVVVAEPGTTLNVVPGNKSETFTPVRGELVGFWSVMVKLVVPPA
jgi:hypothetical protein